MLRESFLARARIVAGALWVLVVSCGPDERLPLSDGGAPKVGVLQAALESPVTAVVAANGDMGIKSGTPNQNLGGDLVLRLQATGRNRGIVLFDTAAIAQAVGTGTLISAALTLDIDNTGNNWGSGAPIGAHRLTRATAEYSATWNCGIDGNVYNGAADCTGSNAWTMWSASNPSLHPWIEPATGLATITSNLTGSVSFNVTTDVAGYLAGTLSNYGWLLKKENESDAGQIDFKSKERGANVGPRLVLTIQPAAPPTGGTGGSAGTGEPSTTTTVLTAAIDSHIRQGSPNQNYGATSLLQVKATGRNRALVAFDTAALQASLTGRNLASATLELTIAETHANWGPDRTVGAHSLKQAWNEMAVTWNCSWDHNVGNSQPDCPEPANAWTMWGASSTGMPWFDPPKAIAVISSNQTGVVTFDVSRDVACYLAGHHSVVGAWIVKKELESEAGRIDFASRETATPPRLVITTTTDSGLHVTAQDCNPPVGTGSCTPTSAIDVSCNGVDDDCDGQADDDFSVVDTTCGYASCASTGVASCVNGTPVDTCVAGTPPSTTDSTCDGFDDDCNGQEDEDFVVQATTCAPDYCVPNGQLRCVDGEETDTCDVPCEGLCIDRLDNDEDGDEDCEDSDCAEKPSCVLGMPCDSDATCAALELFPGQLGVCVNGFPGQFCASSCDLEAPGQGCPPGGICFANEACLPECDEDGGCLHANQHCQSFAWLGFPDFSACMPNCDSGACPDGTFCGAGTQSCISLEETDDRCDGDDNDQDGEIDEDLVLGTVTCGHGACENTVPMTCVNGVLGRTCAPLPGCESNCHDGIDDDNDGPTDCDDDSCADAPECIIGRSCEQEADCEGLGVDGTEVVSCERTFAGGYCTQACGSADPAHECPVGSVCVLDLFCASACTAGNTCDRDGQVCGDLSRFGTDTPFCFAQCPSTACAEDRFCVPPEGVCFECIDDDTLCDNLDADCDGSVDDDFVAEPTTCGIGACAATGANACIDGAIVDTCSPSAPALNDSECDGLDADCDGETDEDAHPTTVSCGVGACAALGTSTCVDSELVVECTPGTPASEDATCDAVDDDCDGQTDEDYVQVTTTCGTHGCRNTTTTACIGGEVTNECEPRTDCEASCVDGADNDSDTEVDCSDADCAQQPECVVGDACTTHDDCAGLSVDENALVFCADTLPGGYCLSLCGAANPDYTCPEGSICLGDSVCVVPCTESDTCHDSRLSCLEYSEGGETADFCRPTCAVGSCARGCDPVTNLCANCAPSDTECNGVDDDCNGDIDEDYASAPTSCGVGACASTGTASCVGGQVVDSCQASCEGACLDGEDDDGDSAIDCADSDCAPKPECVVGGPCTTSADCSVLDNDAGAGLCETGFPGGYCYGFCDFNDPDGPCPEGSVCFQDLLCVRPCVGDQECTRADQHCQDLTALGVPGEFWCVPNCTEENCTGDRWCDNTTGLCRQCLTSDATCNGSDDDCDGDIDEEYATGITVCGAGLCTRTGQRTCVDGAVIDSCVAGCEGPCLGGGDEDRDGFLDCADTDCTTSPLCTGELVVGIGSPCCTNTDCAPLGPNGTCELGFPGGYCYLPCGPGGECPAGAECWEGTTCVVSCETDGTCSDPRFTCDGMEEVGLSPDPFCRPSCADDTTCECDEASMLCTTTSTRCDDICTTNADCNNPTKVCHNGTCTPTCVANGCGSGQACDVPSGECYSTCTEPDTTCNGIDEDCDNSLDESYESQTLSCGTGICTSTAATQCVGGTVQGACVPGTPSVDSSCNAQDDDCDGSIDEHFVTQISCGIGVCHRNGSASCFDGVVQETCVPGAPAASDASCNGLDNDCDGAVDEAYIPVPTSCGTGACASAGESYCDNGTVRSSCVVGAPTGTLESVCNGVDDDCDGGKDEDYVPHIGTCGLGMCQRSGFLQCFNGQITGCTPGTPAPFDTDSTCNNVDSDCDGEVDEGYAHSETSCGVGACAAHGLLECQSGEVVNSCSPSAPALSDATCNGIDDDCSGQVDEDYVVTPTDCGPGACVPNGTATCVQGQVVDSCAALNAAVSDDDCNGVDGDCDGSVDEGYLSETTSCGIGACASRGGTSCVQGAVVNSCHPGTPAISDITCDSIDDDCDGSTDESFVSAETYCGFGVCAAVGATSCVDGELIDNCIAGTTTSPDDNCDGVDDDCNGVEDDGFEPIETTCGIGACAAPAVELCSAGFRVVECGEFSEPTGADDSCDAIDDDCDGAIDEAFVVACDGAAIVRCEGGIATAQSCSDGDACNGEELCSSGACVAGSPVNVDDGNSCTLDACVPDVGVTHTGLAIGTRCASDGNLCTGVETCHRCEDPAFAELVADGAFQLAELTSPWVVVPSSWRDGQRIRTTSTAGSVSQQLPQALTAGKSYRVRAVRAAATPSFGTAATSWTVSATGAMTGAHALGLLSNNGLSGSSPPSTTCFTVPADRSDLETLVFTPYDQSVTSYLDDVSVFEVCSCSNDMGTVCAGVAPDLDDDNPCTADSCDAVAGPDHTPVTAGTACDDGNFCTVGDTCSANGRCDATEIAPECATSRRNQCTSNADCTAFLGPTAVCLSEATYGIPRGTCSRPCSMTPPLALCPSGFACHAGSTWESPISTSQTYCLPICHDDFDCDGGTRTCIGAAPNVFDATCDLGCRTNADCGTGYFCTCGELGSREDTCGGLGLHTACLPTVAQESSCTDGVDDDGNGLTDSRDPFCAGQQPAVENCYNNADDDGDGFADCHDRECRIDCDFVQDFCVFDDRDGDGLVYCEDPDCHAYPACSEGSPALCANYRDDDADGLVDCGDPDCGATATCGEHCGDGVDNDLDGVIDCFDSDCSVSVLCQEASASVCGDGIDNDRDGLHDCQDPTCWGLGICTETNDARCADGLDNDRDGTTDCADPSCRAVAAACKEDTVAGCSDGVDNDKNGSADCSDTKCWGLAACAENTDVRCSDGLDNDHDEVSDCDDTDCSVANRVLICTERSTVNCEDTVDNDRDGVSDCEDPKCACYEWCGDGVDNDGDLQTDCEDDACTHDAACLEYCTDGDDNNRDGKADCRDPQCDGDPSCVEVNCFDGLDNENDGHADCADPECSGSGTCPEFCDNGIDDNGNGFVDCTDPACVELARCYETDRCGDGIDNDRDGFKDCFDADCTEDTACVEAANCRDDEDNDLDGDVDCDDSECTGHAPCIAEICANTADDDGDGRFDCADPDCREATTCNVVAIDPSTVAPPLDEGAPTSFFNSISFLFDGPTPIQMFVEPDAIVPETVAVVRGTVRALDGSGMPGVRISVLGRPDLGETRTTIEGTYAMAVGGGSSVVMTAEASGYFPVQRRVNTDWQGYSHTPDIMMTPFDSEVTAVDLSGSAGPQTVLGPVETDDQGSRRATVVFPTGVEAQMEMYDGSFEPLPIASVRVTEYTVGETGPTAMPADLPPTSGYTYAVDLSADEAFAAGAKGVKFSKPLPVYVDNFLAHPTGAGVPNGSYDLALGAWIVEETGTVVRVLNTANGTAVLDVDGEGDAATAARLADFGITDEELEVIATLFAPDSTFWRVRVTHFSPYDLNNPWGPQAGIVNPPRGLGGAAGAFCDDSMESCPVTDQEGDEGCGSEGTIEVASTISCYRQSLSEDIPIAGAPFRLHYDSGRSSGPAGGKNKMEIPITTDSVSGGVKSIRLQLKYAGRHEMRNFPVGTNISHTLEFDGRDWLGRPARGPVPVDVSLCYSYPAVRYTTQDELDSAFASASRFRTPQGQIPAGIEACTNWTGEVAFAQRNDVAGWDVDLHHRLDNDSREMLLGSGGKHDSVVIASREVVARPTSTFLGNGKVCGDVCPDESVCGQLTTRKCGLLEAPIDGAALHIDVPSDIQFDRTGAAIVLDSLDGFGQGLISRTEATGVSRRIAGCDRRIGSSDVLSSPSPNPECAATEAGITAGASASRVHLSPVRIAISPSGELYILTEFTVLKMSPEGGPLTRVAGYGAANAPFRDGMPAMTAELRHLSALAFAPDGSLVVATRTGLYRIDAAQRIWALTSQSNGALTEGIDDYGAPRQHHLSARRWGAYGVRDVAFGDRGEMLVTNGNVYLIGSDGIVTRLVGGSTRATATPAQRARLGVRRLAFDRERRLLMLAFENQNSFSSGSAIYRLEAGGLTKLAGQHKYGSQYIEGDSTAHVLEAPMFIRVHPLGDILVGEFYYNRIIRLNPPPVINAERDNTMGFASADGSQFWQFDEDGRHVQTVDPRTQQPLYTFGYNTRGQLASVTDAFGSQWTISRTALGLPTSIVSPFGQVTTLRANEENMLDMVELPDESKYTMEYEEGTKLLARFTNPVGANDVTYLNEKVKRDTDAAGGFHELTRTATPEGFQVSRATALTTTPTVYNQTLTTGGLLTRVEEHPDGTTTRSLTNVDEEGEPVGYMENTAPDGTHVRTSLAPDDRFQMQAPVPARVTTRLPSGLERTVRTTRKSRLDPAAFAPGQVLYERTETSINGQTPWIEHFDGRRLTRTITSPMGRETTLTHDSLGKVLRSQSGNLYPTVFTYDRFGRLKTTTTGAGDDTRTVSFSYSNEGYLVGVDGPENGLHTTYVPDDLGRVTFASAPEGDGTGFEYDDVGRMTSIEPPSQPAHTFDYNPIGLMTKYTAPPPQAGTDPSILETPFDVERRPTTITRADGRTLEFQYDPATGRLAATQTVTADTTFGYSATTGQLSSIARTDAQGTHTLAFAYDGGLPTSTTWGGTSSTQGTLSAVYDNTFSVRELRVNGQQVVDYAYDGDGLLKSAGPLAIERNPSSGIISGTRLGAVTSAETTTGFGEFASRAFSFAGSPMYREVVASRDKTGRIRNMTESVSHGAETTATALHYDYDRAGRLVSLSRDGTAVAQYEYDDNGNRLKRTAGGVVVNGVYDAQDRLTRYCPSDGAGAPAPQAGAPCFEYVYAASGELATKRNLSNDQTTTFNYDEVGNLRRVTLPSSVTIEYEIDAAGRRVGKKINGIKQWGLLYQDGLRPIAQLDASNNVVATFVYATRGNVPDYMVKGGQTYRFVVDHLGSVRMVVNVANGSVVQRVDYDEFGVVANDTSPGFQPFGFAGGLYDADTGLVRFGARDYDAVTGRWTAKDPILFRGGQTNLYAYCHGDPVNFLDPTGLQVDTSGTLGDVAEVVGGTVFVAAVVAGSVPFAIGGAAVLAAGYLYNQYSTTQDMQKIDDAREDLAPVKSANEENQDVIKELQKNGDWPKTPDDPAGEKELRDKLHGRKPFCP